MCSASIYSTTNVALSLLSGCFHVNTPLPPLSAQYAPVHVPVCRGTVLHVLSLISTTVDAQPEPQHILKSHRIAVVNLFCSLKQTLRELARWGKQMVHVCMQTIHDCSRAKLASLDSPAMGAI